MTALKNLVDETTNIKNELVSCHSNLKNNLIKKGVKCSSTDKMPSLIDKIAGIVVVDNVIAGESIQLFNYTSSGSIRINKNDVFKLTSSVNGSVKIKINYVCSGSGSSTYLSIDLTRNEDIISSKSFTVNKNGSYINIEYDLSEIQLNDVINIYASGGSSVISSSNGGIVVSCDKL